MRKSIIQLFLIIAVCFISFNQQTNAQIQVGSTQYTTLKAAFDAINAGTHTGSITITVNNNTTETATSVLNASGNGSANYTSVNIYPTGTYSITGSFLNALIELRGADNVTIDGRQNQSGTTNSLTLQNNYNGAAAVIWLDSLTSGTGGGASNNIIRNCNIVGGSQSSAYGIVTGASSSLTTAGAGMDNNQILYNKISRVYYGIRFYGVSTTTPNRNITIRYNTIGYSTTENIGYYGIYIYYASYPNISDNLIQHQNYAGGYGIYNYYGANATISNNTIQNITSTSTYIGLYNYYASNSSISGFNINNITSTGTIYGIQNYYADNCTYTDNTVNNIIASTTLYAIYNYYGSNCTYNRNKLYALRSTSTGGYAVCGFYVTGSTSAGINCTITNNIIYNLTSTNYSASSTVYNPFGINLNAGTGHKVYFNSVNMYGSQSGTNTAGTLSSAFICSGTGVTGIDVRNNSFANSLTGQTGSKSYSIYLSGTANLTGSTINYNDYYASGTYGVLGYLTSDRTTLTNWQSATSQDANSFVLDPNYNANDNLRPSLGSNLLTRGTPITTVTTDYLSNSRSATTPTVGAYESAGDFGGPAISFTAIANTSSTASRQVDNIGITDPSNVNNNSGYAPRVYYKKSSNANTYNGNTNSTDGWKWAETISTTSPYSFIIDYSKIYGGISPGNVIEFFFVAQDQASTPNVGANANFTTPPTTVQLASQNFPVSGYPNYNITAVLGGTYSVGTGGTFPSFSGSGGVFQVISNGALNGNCIFEVISDITTEDGTYALNSWTEQGTGGYTLNIRPSSATNRTISGSASGAIIKTNGASRITIDGRYSGSGNYLTFMNNSTATSSAVVHIASTSASGISNVILRNCNLIGGSTTATTYGVFIGSGTVGTGGDNCDNVSIINNNISRVYNGIYVLGTTSNVADNLLISGNSIGSSTSGYFLGFKGIHIGYVNNANITGNTIFGITTTTSFDAMFVATGTTNTNITKNTFRDLMNNGTNRCSGLYLNSGAASNILVANNEFYNIINNGTSGNTYANSGIYIYTGDGYKIYHNSIVLTGDRDAVGSSKPTSVSACLFITTSLTGSIYVKDNLFYNTQIAQTNPSSAQCYAIYCGSSSTYLAGINYNDYYFSGATSNYLGYLTSSISTLSAWQTATGQDGNSISSNPSLNNTNVLQPLPNSSLLNAGTPVTEVTDDITGTGRSTIAPSIGAYESGRDVSGPIMSFTPLPNTSFTTNRTLTNFATITDYSGIGTFDNAPRLYFRKTTDANTYVGNTSADNGWKYVSGTPNAGFYSFTIDYSLLRGGSVSVGDVIEYFVIAQDQTVGTYTTYKNGTLTTVPTGVALTSANFPISGQNSYTIVPSYSGTFLVGLGQTYTSLSKSDGLFNFMNQGVLVGDVTIKIVSDLLFEDGTVGLNEIPSEGSTNYNITIQPNSATNYTISGSSSTSLIRFNGTDRVTIDGSFAGAGRYLTFKNTSTSGTIATIHFISNTYGAKYNTVKNCNISTGFNTSGSFGIFAGEAAISTSGTGADNDNLTIQNNVISKAYYGLFIRGTSGQLLDNLIIKDNSIGSNVSTDYIGYRGMDIQNATAPVITNNTIFNMQLAPSTNIAAIEVGGTFTSADISKNKIYSIKNPNSGGWGAYGISVLTGTNITIANNFIWDISTMNYSVTSMVYNPFAIKIAGGTNINLYNNTINMYGQQGSVGSTASLTACVLVSVSTVTGLDVRNNIFVNGLTGSTGTKSYTIYVYSTTPSTCFSQMDNNIYYVYSGGILAAYGTTVTDIADLSGLRTYYSNNANSRTNQPYFISDTDLHLTGTSVGDVNAYVTPLSVITTDIDGESRRATNSYIGADEVIPIISFNPAMTLSPSQAIYCSNQGNVTVSTTPQVTGFVDGISRSVTPVYSVQWFKNGSVISGATSTTIGFSPIMQTDSANYNAIATYAGVTASTTTSPVKVETQITILNQPANKDLCSTDPNLIFVINTSGNITGYQWQKEDKSNPGTFINIPGQNSSTLNMPVSDAQQSSGRYRLLVTGPGNCGPAVLTTNPTTVVVTDPITNIINTTDVDIKNICTGTGFKLSVSASGSVVGFQWQKQISGVFTNLDIDKFPTSKTSTLVVNNSQLSESGKYRCLISGSPTCNPVPVPSPDFDVIVWPLFTIKGQPQGQLLCKGDSVSLIIIADGTIYSYQWQKDGVNIDPVFNPSATKPIFTLRDMSYEKTGIYTCVLKIQDCSGLRYVSSNPALLYVITNTKIVNPMKTTPVALGGVGVFEINAHVEGAPDGYKAEVQWYRGTQPLQDNDRISGTKSSILAIKDMQVADFGTDYWVIVRGICLSDTARSFSFIAPTLTMAEAPVDATVCIGQSATYTLKLTSNISLSQVKYQWYIGNTPLKNDDRITGAQSTQLTIRYISTDDITSDVYCIATLEPGSLVVQTNKVKLDVLTSPVLTSFPPSSLTMKVGEDLNLAVTVAGSLPMDYQWFKNNNAISGATNSSLSIKMLTANDGGIYYCRVTNACSTIQSDDCLLNITTYQVTGVNDSNDKTELNNEPNPFSESTEINFSIQAKSMVKCIITDNFGKEIKSITNQVLDKGDYKFNFSIEGLNISSGTYYCNLYIDDKLTTHKMILIK